MRPILGRLEGAYTYAPRFTAQRGKAFGAGLLNSLFERAFLRNSVKHATHHFMTVTCQERHWARQSCTITATQDFPRDSDTFRWTLDCATRCSTTHSTLHWPVNSSPVPQLTMDLVSEKHKLIISTLRSAIILVHTPVNAVQNVTKHNKLHLDISSGIRNRD